jgi:hypothetical protein
MRCDECRWWNPPLSEEPSGECRRFPPTVEHTNETRSEFPAANYDDWCGEFKPKDDPDEMMR